ncbi:hypothetical protein [Rhodococcus sp. OK519]|uniref:hypothetical protein n=1 Tax=Rhodococcus sp. OK519 TaxID=2135729 RepID=UPI0021598C26
MRTADEEIRVLERLVERSIVAAGEEHDVVGREFLWRGREMRSNRTSPDVAGSATARVVEVGRESVRNLGKAVQTGLHSLV